MIKLTIESLNKIKEIAQSEGIEKLSIRVKVVGGGCAGFQYDLYFEENILEIDEIYEQDGVKMIVDPLSHQYIDGVTVDYTDNIMGSGFKFLNPNVTTTCGCGSSFSV